MQAELVWTGSTIYPGCYWGSVLCHMRTPLSLLLRPFSDLLLFCLAKLCVIQRVSLDQFFPQTEQTLSRSENLTTRHNTAAAHVHRTELPAVLLTAPFVLVRQDGHVLPLAPLYYGPHAILCQAAQHFTVQMGAKEEVVYTGRLKPCLTPEETPAQPRRRGYPLGLLACLGLPPCYVSGPVLTSPGHTQPGENGDLLQLSRYSVVGWTVHL